MFIIIYTKMATSPCFKHDSPTVLTYQNCFN